MNTDLLFFIGGVGLFLLGMIILTQGLRGLAGGAMRRLLARFTKTPLTGAATGALTTAVIQSSSATTVTAVGFVAAGLLTFPQALGIIFGANIGTTITGWIVAILGFKLQLGQIVLPLVLLGALLRLFGNAKMRHLGFAIAGFSLLFVGIDTMQQGMAQFEGVVTPDSFPDDTISGRLQLVLIGMAITLVTQSSSAGIATALVALSAGTISFAQAAAMVIGMDVGTTFTAALAALGGSTATRQTGYAHVIYNVMTGFMAFFLLGPFSLAVSGQIANGGAGTAQISLVAFHTMFNVIGVLLILPFTNSFARLIMRLVPERGSPLLRRLDKRLLDDRESAVDAATATIRDISARLDTIISKLLDPQQSIYPDPTQLKAVDEALEETRDFMEKTGIEATQKRTFARHLANLHALDHLIRLSHRCTQKKRIVLLKTDPRLRRLAGMLRSTPAVLADNHNHAAAEERLERLHRILRDQRSLYRKQTVEHTASQEISAYTTLRKLDGFRWLHRVAYHLWRIEHHLYHAIDPKADMPAQPDTRKLEVELEED